MITLIKRSLVAKISTQGAWIEQLTLDGKDIFYPKQEIVYPDGTKKDRGGCHVCLPNFGPDKSQNLAQHGFGRTAQWRVLSSREDSVELELVEAIDGYKDVVFALKYELFNDALVCTLKAENKSPSSVRVEPGFHPYFSAAPAPIELGKDRLDIESLSIPKVISNIKSSTLSIGGSNYTVESENLSEWVLWTDRAGDYICVEPTFSGFSFLEEPKDDLLLDKGSSRVWKFSISV